MTPSSARGERTRCHEGRLVPRAKQRNEQLRTHVLRAALELLETDGVVRFTARRIAEQAGTSMPAVYELFGDKAGLVRELFFEGFRLLRRRFDELAASGDARADLLRILSSLRSFVRERPVLAEVMFSQPFAHFDPGPSELKAGAAVREFIVDHARRFLDAVAPQADAIDAAHVLVALTHGLAARERAGLLGTTQASVDRRWALAMRVALDGLSAA
jgi:AcrR family transcriptional regulator